MNLAIIGDYNDQYRPHQATNEAIVHSTRDFRFPLKCDWISTAAIEADFRKIISTYHGYWIAPEASFVKNLSVVRQAKRTL